MRRLKVFWLALFMALTAAPIVSSAPAHACSCVGYDFQEAIDAADLVAEVTFREPVSRESTRVSYDVVVHQVWKGEASRQITIATDEYPTACGLGVIERNTTILVWAVGSDGRYSTSWCAIPVDGDPATNRDRLTANLGEPIDLSARPVTPPRSWVVIALAPPVAVAAIGLIIWLIQRSRLKKRQTS